ncbi:probable glutamine--tRNA ligase [Anopheles bellator]|uniref:probable glutamine--tRNA ligase n=1 Tax=Anopheles bellator TaxID=139047 RepID=UPI002649FAAE|nr:probable glutamine--tRNA ligase [Anopheles bellator]
MERLQALGLSDQKIKETLKNASLTGTISRAFSYLPSDVELSASQKSLLFQMCSKLKPQSAHFLEMLVNKIHIGALDTSLRVDTALEYVLTNVAKTTFDEAAFDKACGVGVVVTPEEVEWAVEKTVAKHREDILQHRYGFNVGKLLTEIRSLLPWVDGKALKCEVDVQIFDLLGPKTEADNVQGKKKREKPVLAEAASKIVHKMPEKLKEVSSAQHEDRPEGPRTMVDLMRKVDFHRPGENFKTDGYVVTPDTERLLKEHLLRTGGKVRTRFPPEPNGILHIGHAKAININFAFAAANDGVCFLRYDDTNPEKEEEKFVRGIRDIVEWLGYKPFKVTYSSDYFQQLYEFAVQLIRKNLAYVCHQTAEQMKGFTTEVSKWRERPIAENLALFEDMKNGKIDEGAATLRMKITLEEGKMDPVAYRIKFIPHHRTGTQWCIYPTYDYTHCLCDSLEDITHSLCTKEFQSRRSSYYWLCNALNIYCPVQWEYARLNVNYTVVSKRKINKLITENVVNDWDDPRLFTLSALRRKGYPAEAINNFCAQMGITGAQTSIDPSALEAAVRDVLNITARRTMAVLYPLKITITNYPHNGPIRLAITDFPNCPEKGSHDVWFDRVVYIEQSDFSEQADKSFRRLTPGQTVGLKYTGLMLNVEKIIRDAETASVELVCRSEPCTATNKPKAYIHWVSKPVQTEVRLYEKLFNHKNPEDTGDVPGGFISDCAPNTMRSTCAYVDEYLLRSQMYEKFQFERVGFFSVDPDTANSGQLVFNRTVMLKEDSGKNN